MFWSLPSKWFPIPVHQLPWDSTPELEKQTQSYNKSLNDILYERCTSHCSHSNGKVTARHCTWQYRLTLIQRPISSLMHLSYELCKLSKVYSGVLDEARIVLFYLYVLTSNVMMCLQVQSHWTTCAQYEVCTEGIDSLHKLYRLNVRCIQKGTTKYSSLQLFHRSRILMTNELQFIRPMWKHDRPKPSALSPPVPKYSNSLVTARQNRESAMNMDSISLQLLHREGVKL